MSVCVVRVVARVWSETAMSVCVVRIQARVMSMQLSESVRC